jgi:hypothetical protein
VAGGTVIGVLGMGCAPCRGLGRELPEHLARDRGQDPGVHGPVGAPGRVGDLTVERIIELNSHSLWHATILRHHLVVSFYTIKPWVRGLDLPQ